MLPKENRVGIFVRENYGGLGKELITWEIEDPYYDLGTDREEATYRSCVEVIEKNMESLKNNLAKF